jgi:RNAse (barnase) inhibitor barstar
MNRDAAIDLAFTSELFDSPSGVIAEVLIPQRISETEDLFAALAEGLHFPWYFGYNFDALWECIRDLSWLPPGTVIIRHQDVPLAADNRDASTYVGILNESVKFWHSRDEHELVAQFPSSVRNEISALVEAYALRHGLI